MNSYRNIRRFEDVPHLPETPICWHFDKATITANDKLTFLEFWDIPRIATAGCLRQAFGRVVFVVSGYDDDERSIFETPEIRNYLRELAGVWPYFFYADALRTPFLCDLIKCMLPALTVIVRDSDVMNATVQVESTEVNNAYRKLLDGLGEACKLDPEMNDDIWNARVAAVQALLQTQFH